MEQNFLIFKMIKIFLVTHFAISFTFAAISRSENNIKGSGREFSEQPESLKPVGVIYLMKTELGEGASLNDAERNMNSRSSEKSQVHSKQEDLHSIKRSVSQEADLLGLPDVDVDTRLYAHKKSTSHLPVEKIPTVKQRRKLSQKDIDSDLNESHEISNNNRVISKMGCQGLGNNLEQEDIDTDLTKSAETPRKSRSESNKLDTSVQKDVDVDLLKSPEMAIKNGRGTKSLDSELNDRTMQKDIEAKRYDDNAKKYEKKSDMNNQGLNVQSAQKDTIDLSKPNIMKTNNQETSEVVNEENNHRMVERNSEKPKDLLDNGLTRSTTYNQYSKQKNLSINRIRYHTTNRGQTGLTNPRRPETVSEMGTQNLGGTQNQLGTPSAAGSPNLIDSTDLTDRSGIGRINEQLERAGNLLSIGNPLPPIRLGLGLQTGKQHSRRPTSGGQIETQNVGAPNLLEQMPVRSVNRLGTFSKSDSIANDAGVPLERRGNLLSIGNLLPPIGLGLGLQTGKTHSRRPTSGGQVDTQNVVGGASNLLEQTPARSANRLGTYGHSDRAVNEADVSLKRDASLLSVGNLLPPVGLLLGLQTGSNSAREPVDFNNNNAGQSAERDDNLLTVGNPLPPVGLQLGVQTGKSDI